MKTCFVSHCDDPANSAAEGSYCHRHYQLSYRGKDPELSILSPFEAVICLVPGCTVTCTVNRLCAKHDKAVKRGSIPSPEGSPSKVNPPCSQPDCGTPCTSIKSGLCHTHASMLAMKGELAPRQMTSGGQCAGAADCPTPAKVKGMCSSHYGGQRAAGNRVEYRPCSFDGCRELEGRARTGHCARHDRQQREVGRMWPLGERRPHIPEPVTPCAIRGCLENSTPRTPLCQSHGSRARSHGLTHDDAIAFLGGEACEACGGTERLTIDHNHDCCKNRRGESCGRCIRGVLCNGCNAALGFLKDDPERIAGLLAYMQAHAAPSDLVLAA